MVANVPFNPMNTSNAAGSFNAESTGYIQGIALDDPSIRNALAGGVLADSETIPMWGAVGISEKIPSTSPKVLGGNVGRATTLTAQAAGQLTGFSVFNQNNSAVNTPQSPVPLVGSGMTFNFYRLGSGARIPVKCDANLVSLDGGLITQKVSWDFEDQMLIPYSAPTFSSGSYDNSTGVVTINTSAGHGLLPGDKIIVSSAAGTGSYADIDGEQTLITGTTGTVLKFTVATGLTMTLSGATLDTGGALDVRVLEVQIGNSMTVDYDTDTGFATWNRSGNTAVILI